MDSKYTELVPVEEMSNSINTIISSAHHLYRPPSLSESFAFTPENIERAASLTPRAKHDPKPVIITETSLVPSYFYVTDNALQFVFHITLISIFETVFFFLYVSVLEDSGIEKTVGGFIQKAVDACVQLTPSERILVSEVLSALINASTIRENATQEYQLRTSFNKSLSIRAWLYVGALSTIFISLTIYVRVKKIPIRWKKLILKNIGLVFMLALYEFMFFMTIISPYMPISGSEVAESAVNNLENQCGIVYYL